MAQQRHVTVIDDLDGTEGARAYRFSWQDATYEVDLSDAHRDELLRALAPYIDAGRRVRGRRQAAPSSAGAGEDRAAVRAWARENGHEISDRGRIPTSVLEAYSAR
ncbi:Lsr2 family protein [Cellulosimicrobium cellulans]|uniref:histone-like nucleoid-structuring protein Lsr2 n=1 Tax=Cellulosimicrobium cellulans TaxID=1710 RepID=UPI0018834BDB|nr:Lsr2 family protein [Cellulosimicrobium cellulans]MBE9924298.1 Lsr2 family protein [Cellulosimicrobium cellulans]